MGENIDVIPALLKEMEWEDCQKLCKFSVGGATSIFLPSTERTVEKMDVIPALPKKGMEWEK